MSLKPVQFLAVTLTALALVPAGAHLFELPNKIGLAQEQYFIVQNIYRGWALFGFVLLPAIAVVLALTVMLRRHAVAFRYAGLALVCMLATLAIFFAWTYPANLATSNWTVVPENWVSLRRQWEYAHATNAVLTFVALCALTLSLLNSSPSRERD
ncbi:MAG: DUF1772 domain-containing protein [Bradyrhizobiaceae bacterium]|nr:MAG: DUF1772 domain-containing protein [Bradyrhizobiaceae bacterium]